MTLDASGRVTDLRIYRSADNPQLDRAAITAAAKAPTYAPALVDCSAGGRKYSSRWSSRLIKDRPREELGTAKPLLAPGSPRAKVAQSVEHAPEKCGVAGSILALGTIQPARPLGGAFVLPINSCGIGIFLSVRPPLCSRALLLGVHSAGASTAQLKVGSDVSDAPFEYLRAGPPDARLRHRSGARPMNNSAGPSW